MCGLSMVIMHPSWTKEQRIMLTLGLGEGIDNRGEHACGYVAIEEDKNISYARKKGSWMRARMRFIEKAANSQMLLMHSRFATCGKKDDPMNAHPFAIRRGGKVVLWGAHNGMISNAES